MAYIYGLWKLAGLTSALCPTIDVLLVVVARYASLFTGQSISRTHIQIYFDVGCSSHNPTSGYRTDNHYFWIVRITFSGEWRKPLAASSRISMLRDSRGVYVFPQ
jgi:hypothetical protein